MTWKTQADQCASYFSFNFFHWSNVQNMLDAAQAQCFNFTFVWNDLIEGESKASKKFGGNCWRNCEISRRSKRTRQSPTSSAWYWNDHCMHSAPIKSNTIIIIHFETPHNQICWFIVPPTHAGKDEICPNCFNFNLLLVNTCYAALRSSSVCRNYFLLSLNS